jgi:hypothetical protein
MEPIRLPILAHQRNVAMVPVFEYIHAISGRLRIKVPEVKRSPAFARRVEELFGEVEGIHQVQANPITGNVLFLHDPELVPARQILATLIAAGYMGMGIDARPEPTEWERVGEFAALVCWVLVRTLPILTPVPGWIDGFFDVAVRFLLKWVFPRRAVAIG